ncbi:MAG: glycolate oxidase binding subunit [Verrucomicrobiota bacterium]
MNAPLLPACLPELVEAVRSTPRLLAVGAGTKPRLSMVDCVKLSTTRLRGIIEYDPSEFTFTALAGTPVREIAAALAERGQYLPFDPFLVEAGATLGGTVASGLSGPGRFRFGGVRDFILGGRFVDGAGRLMRMGGKVVKNAAGFDLPKFFVGSLGRFGVLAELTFKVFPAPVSTLTLRLPVEGPAKSEIRNPKSENLDSAEAAAKMMIQAANTRWELDALDLMPGGKTLCLRLAGPAQALKEISREIFARWPGETLSDEAAAALWSELREFKWAHAEGPLVKIAMTPLLFPFLAKALSPIEGVRLHVSAGGNVAFLSLPDVASVTVLDEHLRELGLPALCLRGNAPLWRGARNRPRIATDVKIALDAENRFPSLDD